MSSKRTYRVMLGNEEPRQWVLLIDRERARSDVLEQYATKAQAVEVGRRLARSRAPSTLVIYRMDGTVERRHGYRD